MNVSSFSLTKASRSDIEEGGGVSLYDEVNIDRDRRGRKIDPNFPCSVGVIVTDVIADNNLKASDEGLLDVKFPFDFPWPVSRI